MVPRDTNTCLEHKSTKKRVSGLGEPYEQMGHGKNHVKYVATPS